MDDKTFDLLCKTANITFLVTLIAIGLSMALLAVL